MKILCVGYRDWALRIYDKFAKNYNDGKVFIIKSYEEYSDAYVESRKPDYILFYGWSWMVNKKIIKNYKCIMLHPSKLPKYRGGSPIQNQIIRGEIESAVTLFLMNDRVDSGPIVFQEPFSLTGTMSAIFGRIEKLGYEGTMRYFRNPTQGVAQKEEDATYFKRRTKDQSEITIDELRDKSADYLYNKIRMLQDPYPNAFIKTIDGKRIVLKTAKIEN